VNQAAHAELLDGEYDLAVSQLREKLGIADRPVVTRWVCPRCSGPHPKAECPTVALDRQMKRVLLDLAMLSAVQAKKMSTDGCHEMPDSRPPPGMVDLAHIWRCRYERAEDHEARERVIAQAQADVDDHKKRTAPIVAEIHDDLETLVIEDGIGFSPEECALAFCTTPRLVRNLRAKHDRDPLTGEPTGGNRSLTIPERRKEVARMVKAGVGVRAMAQILGVSVFTISQDRKAVLSQT
jgi:hypothetical protein